MLGKLYKVDSDLWAINVRLHKGHQAEQASVRLLITRKSEVQILPAQLKTRGPALIAVEVRGQR